MRCNGSHLARALHSARIAAVLVAAGCGLLVVHGSASLAAQYQLQVIAQAGDAIEGRTIDYFSIDPTEVNINNDGEVAFFAHVNGPEGSGWSLMTQRRFIAGAGKVVDGYVPAFNDEDHDIDINERGEVVYTPILGPAHRGVFINERLVFQVGDVIDGRTISLVGRSPRINDAGEIVVEAWYEGHAGAAIFTPDRLIAEFGQRIGDETLGDMFRPHINNDGDIILTAGLIERDVFGVVSPTEVLLAPGDTLHGYPVVDIRNAAFSNSGEVRYHFITSESSIIATADRVLWQPGDGPAGHSFEHLAGANVVLNAKGVLAYLAATVDNEGYVKQRFLVVGDTLIASEGDMIGGKRVVRLKPNFDMNDLGQVAFRVRYEDETEAVVLATRIVPEPSGILLAATALTVAVAMGLWRSSKNGKRLTNETPASPLRRGGDLSQDRQFGGVSCVCHRFVGVAM